jgi:allantoin racemase
VNSDGKHAPPLADPDGVSTVLHDLRFRVLARSPYEHLMTELGTLDAAERALAEGCDAIYVDTFGDYAVDRIRVLAPVPVVGAWEQGIKAAAALGDFSVVTVWPESMGYLYDERLGATPGGERCRGVHHLSGDDELERVGRGDGVKARMLRGESDILSDLVALSRAAVERDGTRVVLLGCTCMAPVAEALGERLGVPVVDPSRVGLAVAHEAARAHAADPGTPAPSPVRHEGLAGELVSAYLAAQDTLAVQLDDCEVCAVTAVTAP